MTGSLPKYLCLRSSLGLLSVLLLFIPATPLWSQDIRTQELLLDDNAPTATTRNTLTLRAATDDSLTTDYILLFPSVNGLAPGSFLYIDKVNGSTATSRWLQPEINSVLHSDATGLPYWGSTTASGYAEWADGDTIGLSGVIYARQALENGSADTVVITDAGRLGVGTNAPDGLVTIQGAGDLFRAKDASRTLRSVLTDNGEQNWYLGNQTGDIGRLRVGAMSGFPSFSILRQGDIDRFDIINRSLYTSLGYNADAADTGGVLAIAQGGNVGIGLSAPQNKLHVSATTDPLRLDGLQQDNSLDSILAVDASGVVHWMSLDTIVAYVRDSSEDAWLLTGNLGTNPTNNFVGTRNAVDLSIRANSTEHIRLDATTGATNVSNSPGLLGSWNTLNNTLDMATSPAGLSGGGVTTNELLLGAGGSTGTVNVESAITNIQSGAVFNAIRGQLVNLSLPGGALPMTLSTYSGVLSDITSGSNITTIGSYYGLQSLYTGNPVISNGWGLNVGSPGTRTVNFTGVEVKNISTGAGTRRAYYYDGTGTNKPFVVNSAGQVGIGVASPASGFLLEVDGTSAVANVRMTSLSGAGGTTALSGNDGVVIANTTGDLRKQNASSFVGQYAWLLTGNAGTSPSTNFLGTTDNQSLVFRTNNIERARVGTNYNLQGGRVTTVSGLTSFGWSDSSTVSGGYAAVTGGQYNAVTGDRSAVTAGLRDTVSGGYSSIGGGAYNKVSGNYSTIPGGSRLTLGSNSFGFNVANTTATQTNLSGYDSIAYFGNGNIWLGNTDNTARSMRFYEPNTSSTFTGSNYTSLRSQAQAQDIEYIFPDTNGVAGDVLIVSSRSGNQATLDWASIGDVNTVGRLLFARKTADETSSSTSLQNDDHLVLALAANKTYEISGALYIKRSSGNGSFDVAWDVPTGCTMLISFFANESKTGNSNTGADIRDQDAVGQLNGTGYMAVGINTNWNVIHFKGLVVMGSTAGNIQQLWAPSGGGTATVYKNSYMGAKIAEN